MSASSPLNLISFGTQLLNSSNQTQCKLLLPSPANYSLKSSKPITICGWKAPISVPRAASAVDYSDPAEKEAGIKTKYHFVVANAKFMLDEEEHFQELMAERLRNYVERNKEQDFWLVIEPKFLDKFPEITKRLKRPAVALVSTNSTWIRFMKLRLDRVLEGSFEGDNFDEALASNPPASLEFDKPEKWTAPYPKYESGWWDPYLPTKASEV